MKRLQISLDHELNEELGRTARAEGVSKAEIVRRCLREGVQPSRLPPLEEDPIFGIFGIFGDNDGPTDISENVDHWVYDVEFEKWRS